MPHEAALPAKINAIRTAATQDNLWASSGQMKHDLESREGCRRNGLYTQYIV